MAVRSSNPATECHHDSPANIATSSGRPVARCHQVGGYRRGLGIGAVKRHVCDSARKDRCGRRRCDTSPFPPLASTSGGMEVTAPWWWRPTPVWSPDPGSRHPSRRIRLGAVRAGPSVSRVNHSLVPVTAPWDLARWPTSRRRPDHAVVQMRRFVTGTDGNGAVEDASDMAPRMASGNYLARMRSGI